MIVDQHTLHLEVRSLTVLLVGELDEGILQAVASFLVADDFAGKDLAKARKDELQILVSGDRVQLADEQDLLWRCHICEG